MECYDILVRNVVKGRMHLRLECRELLNVCRRVLFVGICVGRVCFLQLICDVAHLLDGIRDAEPDVRVVALLIMDELNAA